MKKKLVGLEGEIKSLEDEIKKGEFFKKKFVFVEKKLREFEEERVFFFGELKKFGFGDVKEFEERLKEFEFVYKCYIEFRLVRDEFKWEEDFLKSFKFDFMVIFKEIEKILKRVEELRKRVEEFEKFYDKDRYEELKGKMREFLNEFVGFEVCLKLFEECRDEVKVSFEKLREEKEIRKEKVKEFEKFKKVRECV